jgi:hypothetical protein
MYNNIYINDFVHSFWFKVFEYMSLSKPNTSGSGHSIG